MRKRPLNFRTQTILRLLSENFSSGVYGNSDIVARLEELEPTVFAMVGEHSATKIISGIMRRCAPPGWLWDGRDTYSYHVANEPAGPPLTLEQRVSLLEQLLAELLHKNHLQIVK